MISLVEEHVESSGGVLNVKILFTHAQLYLSRTLSSSYFFCLSCTLPKCLTLLTLHTLNSIQTHDVGQTHTARKR